MSAALLLCWAAMATSQERAVGVPRRPPAVTSQNASAGRAGRTRHNPAAAPVSFIGPPCLPCAAPPFPGFFDPAFPLRSCLWCPRVTGATDIGPATIRHSRRVCDPFVSPFFAGFPGYGFSQVVSDVFAFGPPGFVLAPHGFGGFAPFPAWPPIAVPPPPVFVVPPPVAFAAPAQLFDPRAASPLVAPAAPRGGTMDIPRELVDQLVRRARPTLAQRAQSAKLEGSGDRMFRAGQYAHAAERYQQSLAQTPDHDELSFKRGAALVAVGRYDEAGRVLRDALAERPDWPFVAHDLRQLFPDEDSIHRSLDALRRESRKPSADPDVPFLEAYILYFSGQRDGAEPILRNPPEGGPVRHFQLFVDAIDRQRGAR